MIEYLIAQSLSLHAPRSFLLIQKSSWDSNIQMHKWGDVARIDESEVLRERMHQLLESMSLSLYVISWRLRPSQLEQSDMHGEVGKDGWLEVH